MLLAIDAGNSTIAFGLYPDPANGEPLHVAKVRTDPAPSVGQCTKLVSRLLRLAAERPSHGLRKEHVTGTHVRPRPDVIVSSVVPRLNRTLLATAGAVPGRRLCIQRDLASLRSL